MRRLEGILRSQLYEWGEIKAQYDFDKGAFRDLYLRWVSERAHTPTTVTIGNQKEPFGLDHLSGNKFGIAQERSAPSHAFGGWRSKGVRLHRAFQLAAEDRKVDIFEDDTAFVTTSIGVFTEDIEETNDTDLAVTARVTGGTQWGNGGAHLGLAASYREGDFQRISFLPEVREADRIVLARPESNTLGILGLEGAYIRGPLQVQAEAQYGQYNGRVNGYGGGGYVQAAWLVTGGRRKYNPRWGTLAPYKPAGRYSVEVFARLSHTRGDDDIRGWNDFKAVTLGSSFFFRNLRCSINVLYGESREPIATEDSGLAVNVRAQYLF
jgi:phosphate-selective porin OprO/OprP